MFSFVMYVGLATTDLSLVDLPTIPHHLTERIAGTFAGEGEVGLS